MRTRPAAPANGVRRRPKDRKAQILRAAAESFSARGYHAVGMDDIAAQLGISATALYRHYANKYDLFRACVLALGQQLVDATAFCDELPSDAEPDAVCRRIVAALTEVAIANRESSGLYRWEGRYLRGDDQSVLMAQIQVVNRRIQRPLMAQRPTVTSVERWILSAAALSVIGSIADHRVKLSAPQIRALLPELVGTVLAAELPSPREAAEQPSVTPRPAPPLQAIGRYEAVLQQSLLLFDKQGYHETGIGEIAASVGIPPSGIYRYFAGKQDILCAVFRRAADRISAELSSVLSGETNPVAALHALIGKYVANSFANRSLAHVYYTERVNLPDADQEMLRDVQRATVDSWVRLVTAARPGLDAAPARFAVHAAMALVIDLGRLVSSDDTAHLQAAVRRLMAVTLGLPAPS